jgi:hypothetical protein
MKALTIKQPWLHAILREGKDIENRSWQRPVGGSPYVPRLVPSAMMVFQVASHS